MTFAACIPVILASEGAPPASALVMIVNAHLAAEAAKWFCDPPDPPNSRAYSCSHEMCSRAAYAGGLCNGHYLRRRDGRDMDAPFLNRKAGISCSDCGRPLNGKGAWHLCRPHYRRRRAAVIKGALVAALGGKCAHCEGVFPLPAFDFHHTGSKDGPVSELIANAPVADVCAEVSKCILLCANCHRIEHADE